MKTPAVLMPCSWKRPFGTIAGAAALFDAQKKHVFSVMVQILQTDKGKTVVHQHKQDCDAQKICKKIEQHSLSSTQASLDSGTKIGEELMTC